MENDGSTVQKLLLFYWDAAFLAIGSLTEELLKIMQRVLSCHPALLKQIALALSRN